jgi:rhodanese-related sulfurtransferase
MFLVFLPVALAMISLQPNGAKAWGEVDTPSSKQSRLARHLVAIDAYDLVRRNAPQVLFLDVRTEPEVELLGVPRLIDGHVPFLLYATHPAGDGRRRGSQLMINADFVSTVGERLAAKALTTDSAVVLICADGTRSARAADVLAEAGFAQVYTIVDGFEGDQVAGATHSERRAINGWKLSRLPWFYPADPRMFSYTRGVGRRPRTGTRQSPRASRTGGTGGRHIPTTTKPYTILNSTSARLTPLLLPPPPLLQLSSLIPLSLRTFFNTRQRRCFGPVCQSAV